MSQSSVALPSESELTLGSRSKQEIRLGKSPKVSLTWIDSCTNSSSATGSNGAIGEIDGATLLTRNCIISVSVLAPSSSTTCRVARCCPAVS